MIPWWALGGVGVAGAIAVLVQQLRVMAAVSRALGAEAAMIVARGELQAVKAQNVELGKELARSEAERRDERERLEKVIAEKDKTIAAVTKELAETGDPEAAHRLLMSLNTP